MSNAVAIIFGSLLIGTGVALSGAIEQAGKQYLDRQEEAACWLPAQTAGLNNLATEVALPQFKQSFDRRMPQADQDAASNSFAVTLSNFSFAGASSDWGTINCRAGLSYTYQRADNSVFSSTDQSIVTFTAHPAQSGFTTEMSMPDIPPGTVAYVDNPDPAPPNPPTPALAPAPTPAPAPSPQATAPTVTISPESANDSQGHTDRLNAKIWMNDLQGVEKEGALFWVSQRSLSNPESCTAGAAEAHPFNASDQTIFVNGCQEATALFAPMDQKQKTN